MKNKKTLLFDFDGVINSYTSGWKGIDIIPDEPVEGVKELIDELRKEYEIKIYSVRCTEEQGIKAIEKYLEKYNIVVDGLARKKEKSFLTIDDRCIVFRGDCKKLKNEIDNFKVWNREELIDRKIVIERIIQKRCSVEIHFTSEELFEMGEILQEDKEFNSKYNATFFRVEEIDINIASNSNINKYKVIEVTNNAYCYKLEKLEKLKIKKPNTEFKEYAEINYN